MSGLVGLAVTLVLISTGVAYGQELTANTDQLTASTDKTVYHYGEDIHITGECIGGYPITMQIFSLDYGELVLLDQIFVLEDQFTRVIKTEGSGFLYPSQYDVKLQCLITFDQPFDGTPESRPKTVTFSTSLTFELLPPRDAPEPKPKQEKPAPVPEPEPGSTGTLDPDSSLPLPPPPPPPEPVETQANSTDVTEPAKLSLAPFVDESKDPQTYVDRYNNDAGYRDWFDHNYPEYATIYEAVGLDESVIRETEETPEPTKQIPAEFVDESEDPQTYVDRYSNEVSYKKWFDENYPEYATIYEAVGLDEPVITEIENIPGSETAEPKVETPEPAEDIPDMPDNSTQTNSTEPVPETMPEPVPVPEPTEVEPATVDPDVEERLEKLENRVGILEGLLDSLKSIFGL